MKTHLRTDDLTGRAQSLHLYAHSFTDQVILAIVYNAVAGGMKFVVRDRKEKVAEFTLGETVKRRK